MFHYYLNNNRQPSSAGGNYELHKSTCPYYYYYNNGNNFVYIGYYSSDMDALKESMKLFPNISNKIDGCIHCCPSIHRG